MAQIAINREGQSHRETKTFDRKQAAAAWLESREKELSRPGGLERASGADPFLGEVIDTYISDMEKGIGRTKAQVLRSVKSSPLGALRCSKITSVELVDFVRKKIADDRVKPQTAANYLSHIGAVFSIARPAWGFPLDPQAMENAWIVTKKLGLTGKSRQRDRRPTLEEMAKLMDRYAVIERRRPSSLPMRRIMAFSLFSTRRMEEVASITWADFEPEASRVMVRDMKHPDEKIGNHTRCHLPPEAVAIIKATPRRSDRIFPYNVDAISASFTRSCAILGIDDLHFHDLRHEGVSRLFELGWNIPFVATVSGHRSWTTLKRYAHLRQSGDKWAGVPWLADLTGGVELNASVPSGEAMLSRALP